MQFPLILKVSGSLTQVNHTPGCAKSVQSGLALVYTESDARNKTTKSQRGYLRTGCLLEKHEEERQCILPLGKIQFGQVHFHFPEA